MSVPVVVNTSLALKWVLPQLALSQESAELLVAWGSQRTRLLVPRLFFSEVANALYDYVRNADPAYPSLTLEQAQASIENLSTLVEPADEDQAIAERALAIAVALGRRHMYDEVFVALAEREQCELWTADEKHWNAVKRRYPMVRCVAEPNLQMGATSS